jgi:hypothetical protein
VSLSLILAIVLLMDSAWERSSWRAAFAAGLCALWLAFDRPFSLMTLSIVFCAFLVSEAIRTKRWPARSFLLLLPLAFFAGAGALVQLYSLQNIPVYAEWNRQHILPTPPLWNCLLAAGLLIPLAALGFRPVLRNAPRIGLLAAAYVPIAVLLSQVPVGFQERFWEGIPLFLGLFAAGGAMVLLQRIQQPLVKFTVVAAIILLLAPSNVIAVRRDLAAIRQGQAPQYLPNLVLNAMHELKRLAAPDEPVMSTQQTGNFIVAHAGRPVVLGQSIQTANYFQKSELVQKFFGSDAADPGTEQLFRSSGARWLFWGPEEAWASRGRFRPSRAPFLEERYFNGFIRLYSLK